MSAPQSAGETPAAPPDPFRGKTMWGCTSCGCLSLASALTFSGGLHCSSCDEVTEMPIEMVYRSAVDHYIATERQHHAQLREERDALAMLLSDVRQPEDIGTDHWYCYISEGDQDGRCALCKQIDAALAASPPHPETEGQEPRG